VGKITDTNHKGRKRKPSQHVEMVATKSNKSATNRFVSL